MSTHRIPADAAGHVLVIEDDGYFDRLGPKGRLAFMADLQRLTYGDHEPTRDEIGALLERHDVPAEDA